LLAGFSFTNVIVIVISGDTGHFRWPGEAIISWTVTSIAFIASVQFAKYVAGGTKDSKQRNWRRTEFFYHFGVIAFLLGFGFALAPQHSSGPSSDPYAFRCVASIVAFAACAIWGIVYVVRGLNALKNSTACPRRTKQTPPPFRSLSAVSPRPVFRAKRLLKPCPSPMQPRGPGGRQGHGPGDMAGLQTGCWVGIAIAHVNRGCGGGRS
jgi:hypothetical protein